MSSIIAVILFSGLLGAFFVVLLIPLAIKVNLVDRPAGRKQHVGNIPLVGGPAILFTLIVCEIMLFGGAANWFFLSAAIAIVLLGVLDDRFDVRPIVKLCAQLAIALYFIYFGGVKILQIGDIFGSGQVELGVLSVGFTAACMLGVINSINMIDGVDGLAGGIVLMTFSAMTVLVITVSRQLDIYPLLFTVGALVGFLVFNSRAILKQAAVFLGDSGSMLLGFVMVWYCVVLTQSENPAFSPIVAGWLFGLPLADTISVIVLRLRKGQSPFTADRCHLHHCLIDAGVSLKNTTSIILAIHACFIFAGILWTLVGAPTAVLFWAFVAIVVMHHFMTPKLISMFSVNQFYIRD